MALLCGARRRNDDNVPGGAESRPPELALQVVLREQQRRRPAKRAVVVIVREVALGQQLAHHLRPQPVAGLNNQVQQRGRLQGQYAAKRSHAGPVRCNVWFGRVYPWRTRIKQGCDTWGGVGLSIGVSETCSEHAEQIIVE